MSRALLVRVEALEHEVAELRKRLDGLQSSWTPPLPHGIADRFHGEVGSPIGFTVKSVGFGRYKVVTSAGEAVAGPMGKDDATRIRDQLQAELEGQRAL